MRPRGQCCDTPQARRGGPASALRRRAAAVVGTAAAGRRRRRGAPAVFGASAARHRRSAQQQEELRAGKELGKFEIEFVFLGIGLRDHFGLAARGRNAHDPRRESEIDVAVLGPVADVGLVEALGQGKRAAAREA